LKKALLFPLTLINYVVNFLWDLYWTVTWPEKVSSRVISVGNITVGGSGKTSLVEYIALQLRENDINPAAVARGYKRPASSSLEICDSENCDWEKCGDEASALAKSCEGLKVYVDSSKTYAAQSASRDGHEIIVVDDGFQHRRLVRNLDIVCIDGEDPYGNGWLLPYGLLREPLRSLKRADAFVVFSSGENIDFSKLNLPDGIPVFTARKIVNAIYTGNNEPVDIGRKKIVAFCGIANPESFNNSLKSTVTNTKITIYIMMRISRGFWGKWKHQEPIPRLPH
jgi:tetraacyldisaccharide 4'-kinase